MISSTKNLTELLKARKALDAKIAAARLDDIKARLAKGTRVTVKNNTNDTDGDWVANREIDHHYNEYGYLPFVVVGVKRDTVTLTDPDQEVKVTIKIAGIRSILKAR